MKRSEAIKFGKAWLIDKRIFPYGSKEREFIEMAIEALSDKGYEIGYRYGWQKCADYSVKFWKKTIKEEFEKGISDGNR